MAEIFIENCDCFDFMNRMIVNDIKADLIITSPPYNTSRSGSGDEYNRRYDVFNDNLSNEEYGNWTIDLFKIFDKILQKDGVILYNLSYSTEQSRIMSFWLSLFSIINETTFMVADIIAWKKKSAIPNNVSKNKLTRIVEFIFVICRKNEFMTFNSNKKQKSVSSKNQVFYENIYNLIEASNNDGTCSLNKSTYSSELIEKLLNIYCPKDIQTVIYDPFMGTGSTAIGCEKYSDNIICLGSELSKDQVQYSNERIKKYRYERDSKKKNII